MSNIKQDDQNFKDRHLQCDFETLVFFHTIAFSQRFRSAAGTGKGYRVNEALQHAQGSIQLVCSLSPGIFLDTVLETLLKIMIPQLKKRVKAIFDQ